MTQPDLTPLGERLRERTSPLAPDDEPYGWAHALLCGALGKALEQVGEVFDPVDDDLPPGAPLLDVETCPDWALPWLAQIVGVTIPSGATDDQARALIRDLPGWDRGTPGALRAAAQAFLTGTKTVYFRERNPTAADPPYTLEVVTLNSEVPPSDLGKPVNFVKNPSFEVDTSSGWLPYVGPGAPGDVTITRSAASAYSGGYGARVAKVAGNPTNSGAMIQNPITAGTLAAPLTLNWSAWVRGDSGAAGYILVDWNRDGTYESTGAPFTFTGVWQRVSLVATIPVGTINFVNSYVWRSAAVGQGFDIDAALLTSGPALVNYFDGSMPGYEWTGAPHASTSKPITTSLVRSALMAQKPGGILLSYRSVDSWDWQQVVVEQATWTVLKTTYATWHGVLTKTPGAE